MQRNFVSLPVSILMCVAIATESAQAIVVPGALSSGDHYHLAFVTQDGAFGSNSNINFYNNHVNAQAAMNPSLTGTNDGVEWFAIGSTTNRNARDNAVVGANVPVYLLDGTTKIADGFTDMWDGNLDSSLDLDQFTNQKGMFQVVWTGSTAQGFTKVLSGPQGGGALGQFKAQQGILDISINEEWIDFNDEFTVTSQLPIYALSQQLVVDPAACDFNFDGACGLFDINLMMSKGDLVAGVPTNPSTEKFDLIDNNSIDTADIAEWLSLAGTENGYGSPYRHGDTDNLDTTHPTDRTVDITDFQNFLDGFTGVGSTWEVGNFNGDGIVDITDFSNFFLPNFGATGGGTYGAGQAVPEPTSTLLLGIGALLLAYACRSRRVGR